jgi:hypothetical protein
VIVNTGYTSCLLQNALEIQDGEKPGGIRKKKRMGRREGKKMRARER